ncbi:MAG: hypothetical protein PSU94_08095 [Lacunisphaera sp.]|nr:hypothetical protein [Lacunisphaera sp.]
MPAPSYRDEKRLLDYLVQRLEDRLAGRHETEILRTHPDDHCQLGVLAPWTQELDAEEQPDEIIVEEARADLPPRPAPAAAPPAGSAPATGRFAAVEPFSVREDAGRRPPSSLGLAVALQPEGGAIVLTVTARCSVYSRQFPDFTAQRLEMGNRAPDQPVAGERQHVSLVEKFRRHRLELPPVTFTLQPEATQILDDRGTVQPTFDQLAAQLRADPATLRAFTGNRIVPVTALRDEAGYQQFLQTLRGPSEVAHLRASLRLRARPTETGLRVEVHLCNDSVRDLVRPSNDKYSSLYDAEVKVTLQQGTLGPVELLPVPEDYQYDRNVYALGRNAGAAIAPDRRSVRTSALARYEQPRLTTQERVVARYAELADDPLRVLMSIHAAMVDYARDWADRVVGGNALELGPAELAACGDDLRAFEGEIAGLCAGIAALQVDPRLMVAFRAMNRAFAPPRGRFPSWRMFQIVFIVTQLPALAVRENITRGEWPPGMPHEWSDILERADVLWFPTGGGKTEAYLGLVGCAALYDRLRGKLQGVTAWLRFPLRMLSVQQLQRAIRMVWQMDQQRRELEREHGSLGEPFSLGYFVGSANTPNSFKDQWSFDRLETDDRQRDRLLLVPDCPACGAEDTVEIRLDRANQRVRHVCRDCQVELPVYISDDEIFRFLPTLLVGTVDKIAAIGWQAKIASLWLGPSFRCAHAEHGFVHGDWCVQGCNSNPNTKGPKARRVPVTAHDPAPSLHIQDELHLLQEELGAFAGHYETMVRANEAAASGRPAKVIAATATIAGYEHQARQIYGVRKVRRFPNRGYALSQTFYSILEQQPGVMPTAPKVARIFTAFRPPFLRPADAAARCAEILHEAINELQRDPLAAIATVGLADAANADEVRTLLAYYSRTLTYVGKKDSGIRICQRLEQNSAKEGSGLRPGGARELNVNYLSAHSTLKEIAATIKRAESTTPWAAPNHLDATVATHVISHGVDVEYYNLMFLERIPEQISDYIQVASRSGRQHVGLILAVLPRYSLRASSIYDRFAEFHRHLDRMVLPVPVNRFAKAAAARSFPGMLLGALYGRHFAALTGTRAQQLRLVVRGMSAGLGALTRDSLRAALRASYALDERIYDPSLEAQMGDGVERLWQGFLLEVRHPQHDDLTKVFDPKPMSSLRDVDVTIPFRPDNASMGYQDLLWFEQS